MRLGVAGLLLLAACGPKPSPEDRYVQVLQKRLDGGAEAYRAGLEQLARDVPGSRAGRRAYAALHAIDYPSGHRVDPLADSVVPVLSHLLAQLGQEEATANLRSLWDCLRRSRVTLGRYGDRFSDLDFRLGGGCRYLYYLSEGQVLGGDGAMDPDLLRRQAEKALADLNLRPVVTEDAFLVVAVGDPDFDLDPDVWSIDHHGNLVHVLVDFE